MTRFITIRPKEADPILAVERDSFEELKKELFEGKGVDFGGLGPDHSIVVYEWGLYESADNGQYFRIGKNLYVGPAIVFHHVYGETVDVMPFAADRLSKYFERFASQSAVEAAIKAGRATRPEMKANDAVVWRWPEPREKNPLLNKSNWGL